MRRRPLLQLRYSSHTLATHFVSRFNWTDLIESVWSSTTCTSLPLVPTPIGLPIPCLRSFNLLPLSLLFPCSFGSTFDYSLHSNPQGSFFCTRLRAMHGIKILTQKPLHTIGRRAAQQRRTPTAHLPVFVSFLYLRLCMCLNLCGKFRKVASALGPANVLRSLRRSDFVCSSQKKSFGRIIFHQSCKILLPNNRLLNLIVYVLEYHNNHGILKQKACLYTFQI